MGAVGGDILEVTYNHPTLGSGTFFPKSSEASTYDLGGFRSRDEANAIDGSGAPIDTMNQVRGFFEVVVSNDMNTNQELEKAVKLAESPLPATYTFTCINGVSYSGSGKPVGDLTGDVDKATFKLKVSGGKFLKV
jgi:hypothetical protein